MKKAPHVRYYLGLLLIGIVCLSMTNLALAAEQRWKVKANDRLNSIVSKNYPDYTDEAEQEIIAQAIIKANPAAFTKGDRNRLVVGKTLKLPQASAIKGLEPAADQSGEQTAATETDKANADKDKTKTDASNEAETKSDKDKASTSEADSTKADKPVVTDKEGAAGKPTSALQEQVKTLETQRQDLEKQASERAAEIAAKQQTIKELEVKVAELQKHNEGLKTDLQKLQEAKQQTASSSRLSWILAGLLAFLMLPLLWLLKRSRAKTAALVVTPLKEPAPAPENLPVTTITKGVDTVVPVAVPLAGETASADATPVVGSMVTETAEVEPPDADVKLDIARAYLELRDSQAAADILQDILKEGSTRQRQEAREILSFIS